MIGQVTGSINFRANTTTPTQQTNINSNNNAKTNLNTTKPDEFVKKEDKKELSTKQKVGIGAGILAFAGLVAAAIFTKGKTLEPANFAEHIDFVKANTIEEAVNFAKQNFNIKTFDFGDDLEMANWVNEGLVNINNRFKGKANIVKKLRYATDDEIAKQTKSDGRAGIAWCNSFHQKDDNSHIIFNKDYINNSQTYFQKLLEQLKINPKLENNEILAGYIPGGDRNTHNQILKICDKMLKKPEEFSRFEALQGIMLCDDYLQSLKYFDENKLSILQNKILNDKKSIDILKANNISVNFEDYKKLKDEDLNSKLKEILALLIDVNPVTNTATVRGNSKFDVLYHEMGHHLHSMNTSIKELLWGRLSKKQTKKFIADETKQQTASKISWYAKTNPKEFVAECFNALCSGRKLPDDVMELYEYYKGPIIPNM